MPPGFKIRHWLLTGFPIVQVNAILNHRLTSGGHDNDFNKTIRFFLQLNLVNCGDQPITKYNELCNFGVRMR